ncbi:S8 family serine peptidase [Aliikangiella coralliicola]|uniref:S8 family serine peptidase n=1 Tax=Aliikangiella coralliicola TaxID=2592383 RepID=A0A545UC78_9GAMM|nr:S8 family serine peptidase [Aliikangiella coralliicola]TQV87069.1 S8 family serine peptidase [Aliikangiella coralliicola]
MEHSIINRKRAKQFISGFVLSTCVLTMQSAMSSSEVKQRHIIKLGNSVIESLQKEASLHHYTKTEYRKKVEAALQQIASSAKVEILRSLPELHAMSLALTEQQKRVLQSHSKVSYVEIDPKRYLLAESVPYGITMVEADQLSDANTGNMKVCVVDTGYTLTHPDLPNSGITGDDGHGNIDTGDWFDDGHGHGTHVAGTIAAIGGNDEGVVGVNPSGLVGLHIVKVFNNQGTWAYGSDLAAAVYQCRDAGATVVNMSLGGSRRSQVEEDAFNETYEAGMIHVAAAGNTAAPAAHYPASYDAVVSVAAIDDTGTKANFSTFNEQVELAAPGVQVNSTLPSHGYAKWNGTSMASPHVAGVAALVWSHFPDCTNDRIRYALGYTAEDKGSRGRDTSYGFGIVKAKAAYDYLNATGCVGSGTGDLVVDFNYSINERTVSFSDQSTDTQEIVSYLWDFGDKKMSTEKNPTHQYRKNGNYRVSLTVVNDKNETDLKLKTITVDSSLPPECDGVEHWSQQKLYHEGDHVFWNDIKYVAIYWSFAANPSIYSNVWKKEGVCSGE